ncbi:MAG: hypothetical protein ACOCU3_01720 [bacterium]
MRLSKSLKLTALLLFLAAGFTGCPENGTDNNSDQLIKPWSENPSYWQYEGEPVLLLGGTNTDNLFQKDYLETHLDSLQAIGGNYIRNTMSDRDSGDHRAFARNRDGKYDLDQWNDEYWNRFENMLRLANERKIIVQIEVWDRFDHSRDNWLSDPYNPGNNINYTYAGSMLDSLYPEHPGQNLQPFFFTVPELDNNEVLLNYQNAFVKKLLSISLNYNNVLYCIDNETSGAEEWAIYWEKFIRENSGGKEIYITQMWDSWDLRSDEHKQTFDYPERYQYIDISQNSHVTGRTNWDNAQYVFGYIEDNPRPVNSTKIYGSDNFERWLHRGITTDHAIQTFFRNILGGFASSRFHRPPAGLGLNQLAINSIRTIRKIEENVKMWDVEPRINLLRGAEGNTAYLAAREGEDYVIYFPKNGVVELDLTGHAYEFTLQWINTEDGRWGNSHEIEGGSYTELRAVNENGSIAVLTRK